VIIEIVIGKRKQGCRRYYLWLFCFCDSGDVSNEMKKELDKNIQLSYLTLWRDTLIACLSGTQDSSALWNVLL